MIRGRRRKNTIRGHRTSHGAIENPHNTETIKPIIFSKREYQRFWSENDSTMDPNLKIQLGDVSFAVQIPSGAPNCFTKVTVSSPTGERFKEKDEEEEEESDNKEKCACLGTEKQTYENKLKLLITITLTVIPLTK